MKPLPFVYLASQSPRRQQLLAQIEVPFKVLLPHDTDAAEALERVLPDETPLAYVQRVTLLKLQHAKAECTRLAWPSHPILCADTTVALGRRILGKPADAQDAAVTLAALSGRTHRVLTSVAVAWPRGLAGRVRIEQATQVSRVRFAALSPALVQAYIASGEPLGVAGAFTLDGLGGWFIDGIDGDPSNVVGLGLAVTRRLLETVGCVIGDLWRANPSGSSVGS
jgi:septum formation protein